MSEEHLAKIKERYPEAFAKPAIPQTLNTRERCQMCWRFSPVGFAVPDDIWQASVHPHFQHSPLCIMCFAAGADERGVAWDRQIAFYPVSFRTHMEDERSPIEHAAL